MVAISLVVLTGWGGHISLGQFAIVGMGAVVAGNIMEHWNVDLFIALLPPGRRAACRRPPRTPRAAHPRAVPRRHHAGLRRGPRQLRAQPQRVPGAHARHRRPARAVGALPARSGRASPTTCASPCSGSRSWWRAACAGRGRAGCSSPPGERAGRRRRRRPDDRRQAQRVRAGGRDRRRGRRAPRAGPAPRGVGHLPADLSPRGVLHGRHRRAGLDRRRPARRVRAAPARAGRERTGAPARHRRGAARSSCCSCGAAWPRPWSPCATSACGGSPSGAGIVVPSLVADVRTEEVAPEEDHPEDEVDLLARSRPQRRATTSRELVPA